MNWENTVVKLNVKTNDIDFDSPLNMYSIYGSSGTGFFITTKFILTCYHVVKYAMNIEVIYKQTNSLSCKIKYIFPDDDLAILELDECIDDIVLLDFKIIKNKTDINEVYTIGFPLGSNNIISTKGIISGFQQSKIQTDAALNSGNSGGPLVINDLHNNKWYFIGINVSKITGNAEKTGFCIPVYRFLILKNYIEKYNITDIVINKPIWDFDYQTIKQPELAKLLYNNNLEYIKKKIGIRISAINKLSYLYKYLQENDIIISINNRTIDSNGFIKFDFYPDKISIKDVHLWFTPNHKLKINILKYKNSELNGGAINMITLNKIQSLFIKDSNLLEKQSLFIKDSNLLEKQSLFIKDSNLLEKPLINLNIELKYYNKNLFNFYLLDKYPSYYIENNNLILSIITKDHLEKILSLNLSIEQIIKITSRFLYKQDLFTIYLSDVNSKIYNKFNKYPIGEIIIEIDDQLYNNYEEFIAITNKPIKKIKTIDNKIFFV